VYFILEIVVRINRFMNRMACETMPSKRDVRLIDAIF
jgi:hypothetical protein